MLTKRKRSRVARIVPKGRAPDAPAPMRRKLRSEMMPKRKEGKSSEVKATFLVHSSPRNYTEQSVTIQWAQS